MLIIKNIISFFVLISLSYAFYRYVPMYHDIFNIDISIRYLDKFSFKTNYYNIFFYGVLVYSFLYLSYYYLFANSESKPLIFFRLVFRVFKNILNPFDIEFSKKEKLVFLNILVKFIFLPLMFFWFCVNMQYVINTYSNIIDYIYIQKLYSTFYDFYRKHLHWLLLNIIMFLDVTIFMIWYSIESKLLKNEIKSVEPTFIWWIVTLLCYPLLNYLTAKFLNWYSSDMPDFVRYFWWQIINLQLSTLFGILFIILMWLYVWASFSLWLKASNLTNRWIVDSWLYKFIRHPAYFCKNMARFVWALPFIIINIKNWNYKILWLILLSLFWRMIIYHLRAITEERHLWLDPDYIKYKQKVRYMYLYKII